MRWRLQLVGFLGILLLGSSVWAGYSSNIQFDGLRNRIQFTNYEMVLRPGSGYGVSDVTIRSTTYSIMDPFTHAPADDDIVVQILEASSLTHPSFSGAPVTGGYLKAYFVGKVDTNETDPLPLSNVEDDTFVPLQSGDTDPFGVISPDGKTMLKWYLDDDTSMGYAYYKTGDTDQGDALERMVGEVTDGTEYFDFGIGAAVDPSGFTGGSVAVTKAETTQFEIVGALNVLDLHGSAVRFFDSAYITTAPATTDSSIELKQTVQKNSADYSASVNTSKSPWYLSSSDPLYLTAIPEPGAIAALIGMLAVCLGGGLIRRFRR